jgi:protein-L-isoaspartate(D-aspartate) O-methyltransferase
MNPLKVYNMKTLLDSLVKDKFIETNKVYNSMLEVDRGDFTDIECAYFDRPNSIKYKATISAPHMHAFALEYLRDYLQPGNKVLDVGSGSGYLYFEYYNFLFCFKLEQWLFQK